MKKLFSRHFLNIALAGILSITSIQAMAHPAHKHRNVNQGPAGAIALVIGGVKYWLKDDVYYQRKGKTYYKVVAPLGSSLARLPKGSVLVKRNGKPYYRHNNVYYRWQPKVQTYQVVRI